MAKHGKYKIQVYLGNQALDFYTDDEPAIGCVVDVISQPKMKFTILVRIKTHELCYIGQLLEAKREE